MDETEPLVPVSTPTRTSDEQSELDNRATNALIRQIDMRLIPLLTILYFFSFLDRINIGNARLFGLETDLNITSSEYNWAISIFYISYVLCEVPSNLIMKRVGPSKWIGSLMLAWGLIMIAMAFVYNLAWLLAARFFLGVAEAGFFPGVIFYLSLWYIRKDQAFRMALFFSGALFAGALGGLLAYGIGELNNTAGLKRWQWLFLIEGICTVCLALIAYKFLADYPATVQWLDQCNKDILTARLQTDVEIIGEDDEVLSYRQIRLAFRDWKVLFYMFINIGALTPVYGFSVFLPSIIKDMGYTNINAQLLTVPPYLISCLTTIVSSWNAGRMSERSTHILIFLVIGIAGFLYLILAKRLFYIGACIASVGVFNSNALVLSWVTNNIGGQTKRAVATALVIAFGNTGGIFSGQIYRQTDEPYYRRGHLIIMGIMIFTFILVLSMKLLLRRENKRRRTLTIEQVQEEVDANERDLLLDKHPAFVYVT